MGDRLRRALIFLHPRLGNQAGAVGIRPVHQFPLCPAVDNSAISVAHPTARFQLFRPGRPQTAVVPGEFHRWHRPPCRKLVTQDGCLGIGLLLQLRRAGFHRVRGPEVQGPEGLIHKVRPHVTDGPCAEVQPPAP